MKMKKAEKQNTQPYTKGCRGSVARLHHARRATLLCGLSRQRGEAEEAGKEKKIDKRHLT